MFKLLKSAGQQVEDWLQDDALDIQRFLVRLSGRQTKRRRPVTAPALLAGLWMLFSTLTLLEHYDLDQLKQYAQFIFRFPNRYGNHRDV